MKRKHHIRKHMACVLAICVCLTYSLGTALADEPQTNTTVSGSETVENPKVTTTTIKESNTDSQTGNTTDTTKIDKDWEGTTENKSIVGKEDAKLAETKSKYGNTLSGSGSASGSQITTIADETKIETKDNETVLKALSTQADPITLELTPNCEKKEAVGKVHAWFTPTTEIVPKWVGLIADGSITWNGSSSINAANVVTNITATSTTSGTDTEAVTTKKYIREDVSALSTIKYVFNYVLDSHGHIIDYTKESYTTITLSTAAEVPALSEIHANGGSCSTSFELPKKPEIEAGQTPVYQEGTNTIVSGQIIGELYNDAGKHVGYVRITYADGKEVKYEAFMGGEVTTASSRETLANGLKKDTVTKTTHTETKGSAVSNSVKDGYRTASASMTGKKGTVTTPLSSIKTYEPKVKPPYSTSTDYGSDLIYKNAFSGGTDYTGEYENGNLYWLDEVGYGLGSKLLVKTTKMKGINAHQFILTDSNDKANAGTDNKSYYVYCADLAVDPHDGAIYNMQRIEDADYYKNSGVINKNASDAEQQRQLTLVRNQIRAIVLNGYWGTAENTAGSIENFRNMLKDKLVKSTDSNGNKTYYDVADITEGMALTATQAAIWYYGNSNADSASGKMGDDFVYENKDTTSEKKALTEAVYKYLINKDEATGLPAENGTGLKPQKATADNTLLTEADFAKSITLTIGDRTADGKYLTDIDITMEQITSGNLTLVIGTADAEDSTKINTIATYNLTDAEKQYYGDGAYHITALELPAGAELTLSFTGTQTLKNGVYLFSSYKKGTTDTVSQTFIGAGQATQEINLSTSFNFNVEDPVFMLNSTNATSSVDTLEWDSSYTIKYVSASKPSEETPEQPKDGDTPDGDKTNDSDVIGGDDSDNNGNGGNSEILGDDSYSDVDIPKTGDINNTLLKWFALIGVSAAGILALKHRKRKQNASDLA